MIITREYCDLCRKEFIDKGPFDQSIRYPFRIQTQKRTKFIFYNNEKNRTCTYEICEECNKKLIQWIEKNTKEANDEHHKKDGTC